MWFTNAACLILNLLALFDCFVRIVINKTILTLFDTIGPKSNKEKHLLELIELVCKVLNQKYQLSS
jgi:hypothetical protein